MKIAIMGYGRMGQMIEQQAALRGIDIAALIQEGETEKLATLGADTIVIEFTQPRSAFSNVMACLENGLPVVCGTTGWDEKLDGAKEYALKHNGAFFYSRNFSKGIQLMVEITALLGRFQSRYPSYSIAMKEEHHIRKLDAPSGTAITLSEALIQNSSYYKGWECGSAAGGTPPRIAIHDVREGDTIGIHEWALKSSMEEMTIRHTATDRAVFAEGAIEAAQFLAGRHGVFGMKDLLFGR